MSIPRPRWVEQRRALHRKSQMLSQIVQGPAHIAKAYRLLAHAGDRGVHDARGQAEGDDAEPARRRPESHNSYANRQESRDQTEQPARLLTEPRMHQQGPEKHAEDEERDRQHIIGGLGEFHLSGMQASLRGGSGVLPPAQTAAAHITDQPIIARLKRIGFEPGKSFDFNAVDPAVKKGLERAPDDAQKLMAWKVPTLARVVNGWSLNTDTMGVYGNYYLKRVSPSSASARICPRTRSIPSISPTRAAR